MVVDSANTFEHFFPVVAGKGEVKPCLDGIEFHADYAGEVGFAEFHELGGCKFESAGC